MFKWRSYEGFLGRNNVKFTTAVRKRLIAKLEAHTVSEGIQESLVVTLEEPWRQTLRMIHNKSLCERCQAFQRILPAGLKQTN